MRGIDGSGSEFFLVAVIDISDSEPLDSIARVDKIKIN